MFNMAVKNWSFQDSVNVPIRVQTEILTNVLGQKMWVPYVDHTILIRNVNLVFGDGTERVLFLSKINERPTIDYQGLDLTLYQENTLFAQNNTYDNVGIVLADRGAAGAVNMIRYRDFNGSFYNEQITNGFFNADVFANKARDKKVRTVDKNHLYTLPIVFRGYPKAKAESWRTTFTIMPPSKNFAYWTKSQTNTSTQPKVECSNDFFYKLDDAYSNKIVSRNKYVFADLIANKVYDSENALALTTVDIYRYNDLYTFNFSSATAGQYKAEKIQAFGVLRWNDLIIKTSAEIEEEGSIYTTRGFGNEITFSAESLNEAMGFTVGVLAISAHGIGNSVEDYAGFAGYALIKLIGGKIADGKYNIDSQNIKVVIHNEGELPPSYKSDDEKNDDNSVNGDNPPSGNTPTDTSEIGVNLLTTTYLLTKTQLNSLGNELWSNDFMKNVLMLSNSPIENVLSCKIFPTTFSGTASALKIGNVTMLNGTSVQKISASGLSKTTGSISFPQLYNSFLDFEPFTQARIFIPFVGFQPLPVANFIGAQLSLRYVFDVVTGAVSVYLLRNGYIFDKYSGICAVDVPLTASNRAQVEVGQIQSAITGVTQLATGNIGGALSAGLAIASTPNHFNTRGNAGGYTSQYDPRQPYLIIDRPKAQSEIASYGKTNGFPCNLTKTLSTLKGFTSVHDVHLDDVPCLESERQELKAIMQKGFVI